LRKLVFLLASGVLVLMFVSEFAVASALEGEAELSSIGGSGITAEIHFVDTGTALNVRGEAEGLNPNLVYISLIYDVGSVATGPSACEPTIGPGQPGFLTDTQMFVGFWQPMGSSERTLVVTKTGDSYAALGTFATISVRHLVTFGPPPVAPLQACGVVEVES
jgi:hypothetical protein